MFLFSGGKYSLGELLPQRFKPSDLLEDPATPLLLEPQNNGVHLTAGTLSSLSHALDAVLQAPSR